MRVRQSAARRSKKVVDNSVAVEPAKPKKIMKLFSRNGSSTSIFRKKKQADVVNTSASSVGSVQQPATESTPALEMVAMQPKQTISTSQELYEANLIKKYEDSEDEFRKFLLLQYNDAQRKILYAHYIEELNTAINNMANADHAKLARDVLVQVELAHNHFLQKYDGYKVEDVKLFDVLHSTAKFISTPPANNDNTPNEDFLLNAGKFSGVLHDVRSHGKKNALSFAGYALLTALVMTAAVMITVLTFGTLAKLTFDVIAFGLINMGGQFGFGIYTGMKMTGFFNQAYRELKIANRMEALSEIINPPAPQAALK